MIDKCIIKSGTCKLNNKKRKRIPIGRWPLNFGPIGDWALWGAMRKFWQSFGKFLTFDTQRWVHVNLIYKHNSGIEKNRKDNARTMYRHECEPVSPILIMLSMMQYGLLCLFWEVGSGIQVSTCRVTCEEQKPHANCHFKRWHVLARHVILGRQVKRTCRCQLSFNMCYLKMSRDTLDLKLNITWNLSNMLTLSREVGICTWGGGDGSMFA